MSKPKGRHAKVRKGKGMTRQVSEVFEALAHLIRAIGVLVDALGRWLN
ncbi:MULTISPECIES: hypothetical protein [unclassified Actinomyces]|nr:MULTISPECIES: hypothetical protein [unclassified Actinomyces]